MPREKKRNAYLRILSYAKPYRMRFVLGLFMSVMLSVFNGLSLTSLKPIFDVIETGSTKPFQLHFEQKEIDALVASHRGNELKALFAKHPAPDYYLAEKNWTEEAIRKQTTAVQNTFSLFVGEKKLAVNSALITLPAPMILKYVGIAVIPIFLLRLIFDFGTVFFLTATGLLSVMDIRRALYKSMMRLPLSYFVREKTGVLMSRIINDVTTLSEATSIELRLSINNFFIIITHIFILYLISAKLLLITMVGVPIILLPVSYFSGKIRRITRNEQTGLADLNGHLQEVISGIRVIRAFTMEDYQTKGFEVINHNLYTQNFRNRVSHQLGPALVELATSFIVVGLIVYGGNLIIGGEMTSGSFFTFVFTLMILLSPIKQMATWFNLVQRAIASGERVFEIIDMKGEIEDPPQPVKLPVLKKEIEFSHVSFSYPNTEKKVLHGINFKAKIGSTVALVGHSGAGKSTLADLTLRFYDPTEGKILFDGIDIRDAKIADLRDKVGMVTQDIFLFNGTVRENISYGRTDISDSDILKASKMAYAHEYISLLPKGYDTVVGERGLMLSGGQRQRLSIARALLKNPEILILDEATSALDTESERLVQRALEKLMKNRTTIVIAHRLSTIYNADMILVLKDGRIVERGTHRALLKKKGDYKKLFDMQFKD
ncbi:MAG: Vitamin B12 import ATP-binding protein BtuD [Turneriella sp.]|nr:Vitamin B12 import ATP-binding protein BtuD [Turneriella sp.]